MDSFDSARLYGYTLPLYVRCTGNVLEPSDFVVTGIFSQAASIMIELSEARTETIGLASFLYRNRGVSFDFFDFPPRIGFP